MEHLLISSRLNAIGQKVLQIHGRDLQFRVDRQILSAIKSHNSDQGAEFK